MNCIHEFCKQTLAVNIHLKLKILSTCSAVPCAMNESAEKMSTATAAVVPAGERKGRTPLDHSNDFSPLLPSLYRPSSDSPRPEGCTINYAAQTKASQVQSGLLSTKHQLSFQAMNKSSCLKLSNCKGAPNVCAYLSAHRSLIIVRRRRRRRRKEGRIRVYITPAIHSTPPKATAVSDE